MKKKKIIILIAILFCLSVFSLLGYIIKISMYPDYGIERDYIAHAGGEIDNIKYTNSKEAVEKSIKDGFHYIELDLALTSDNELVAVHDWDTFRQMSGYSDSCSTPTLDEFRNSVLYNKYTPLDFRRIDSIMSENPDLKLVTDKISTPDIIDKYFAKYKDRLLIECFTLEDYAQLQKKGYFLPMYNQPLSLSFVIKNNVKSIFGLSDYKINSFTIPDYLYSIYRKDIYFKAYSTLPTKKEADSLCETDSSIRLVYIEKLK